MTPSYAFVGEPETNGVIERFFRTLIPSLTEPDSRGFPDAMEV
jgi:transposase InsO family protein